ncbi:GltB/FmdC/FwdC-like GXGXG domain-containing protein, partial [Gluconobacter cerinus]
SGATAVVEGCGSNGCEYMTGGKVVILGETGDNFGAGFTGGMAYVLDPKNRFESRINPDTVMWNRVQPGSRWDVELRTLVEQHVEETGSTYAADLLHCWEHTLEQFWHIVPREYAKVIGYVQEDLSKLSA